MPELVTVVPVITLTNNRYLPSPPKPQPVKAKPANGELVRGMEARQMFGGRALLDRAVKVGWLAPIRQGKRMTLYRRKDILAALQRIEWGELP